jgi:hypothetical protein
MLGYCNDDIIAYEAFLRLGKELSTRWSRALLAFPLSALWSLIVFPTAEKTRSDVADVTGMQRHSSASLDRSG